MRKIRARPTGNRLLLQIRGRRALSGSPPARHQHEVAVGAIRNPIFGRIHIHGRRAQRRRWHFHLGGQQWRDIYHTSRLPRRPPRESERDWSTSSGPGRGSQISPDSGESPSKPPQLALHLVALTLTCRSTSEVTRDIPSRAIHICGRNWGILLARGFIRWGASLAGPSFGHQPSPEPFGPR